MSEAETVRWSLDPTDSRLALACLYGTYGVPGGMALVGILGIGWVGASAALENRLHVVGLVVLLGLVGGPVSLLYLLPMLADDDQRPSIFGLADRLRPLPFVSASVVGACVVVLVAMVEVGLLVPLFWLLAVMAVTAGAFASNGELDVERRTLRVEFPGAGPNFECDLDDFDGYRRVSLGTAVVFRLTSAVRAPGGNQWVVVPASVAPVVERTVETAVAQGSATEPNRLVQGVLVAFSLLFFGVGAFLMVAGRSVIASPWARLALLGPLAAMGLVFLVAAYYG
ncbi:hypothetical protein [Haladaptatus salinisoli]|uniref:hypothetical protein n=1 Tax=Haladaptatus salinisoli TaxID=2884876 RepID=UPI001D0A0A4A|nr:hypothetical protein [Haladaptatus salinisoli]